MKISPSKPAKTLDDLLYLLWEFGHRKYNEGAINYEQAPLEYRISLLKYIDSLEKKDINSLHEDLAIEITKLYEKATGSTG